MNECYILKKKNDGEIVAKFEVTSKIEKMFCGDCYSAKSWDAIDNKPLDWEFRCHAYCKWDGCAHWWFYGEDFHYGPNNIVDSNVADSYYHLCGSICLFDYIRDICFVWKVAELWLTETYSDNDYVNVYKYYGDHERLNQVMDIILDDYMIELF